jgi:prepilin-type N-terminal cleavage/methylation domain-containing protein/prepilin-type processing-associated H-X9-DG protein
MQPISPAPRRPPYGFTLVELLVVIAIISILAAMLMPALESALATARRVQCLNRLRQTSAAAHFYTDDYQAVFQAKAGPNTCPHGHGPSCNTLTHLRDPLNLVWYDRPWEWSNPPGRLLVDGYLPGYDAIQKPSYRRRRWHDNNLTCHPAGDGYLTGLEIDDAYEWTISQSHYSTRGWQDHFGRTTHSVRAARGNYVFNWLHRSHREGLGPSESPLIWDYNFIAGGRTYRMHGEGVNCAYLDGHVRLVPYSEGAALRSDTYEYQYNILAGQ